MAIKTAIIGYGRSGSTLHADPIDALPDFQMTAVCDIDPAAKEKAFKRFGCKIYDDYKEMLAIEDLDLVVIVTRSSQHCRMACDCLKAGKNVLVTKPWSVNAEEAKEMIDAAIENGKLLLPWLPSRWGADLKRLKEIVASGTIGKVFQIRRSMFSFGLRSDWQTEKVYGGGYLLNWGPHLVDQPVQLAGKLIKSVYGELKQIINPGDVEDVFLGVLKTEDNITIITEYNIGPGGSFPSWIVQGNRGTIIVYGGNISIHKVNFPDIISSSPYANPVNIEVMNDETYGTGKINGGNLYGNAMEIYPHIAKSVRGEESYNVTVESALQLSKQLDAIRKSSETGQVVNLDL